MRVVIQQDYAKMSQWCANYIAKKIQNQANGSFVMGISAGSSPLGTYKDLGKINRSGNCQFKNVVTFTAAEYVGLEEKCPQSSQWYMKEKFFNLLSDIQQSNINMLDGMATDLEKECRTYEAKIKSYGGLDMFLGAIGVNGRMALNEPFTSLSSRTGIRYLGSMTKIIDARFFDNKPSLVPARGLSIGIGTIMESREIILLANGEAKARALKAAVEGPVSSRCPCSVIQMHNNALVVCDDEACAELESSTYAYFRDLEGSERL